jgi:hypothetical protein
LVDVRRRPMPGVPALRLGRSGVWRWHCGRLSTAAGGSTGERAVAQFGSALDWGSSGRRFKSCQPDQEK